jgi:hypothetical protein
MTSLQDQHTKRMKDLEIDYRMKLEQQSKLAKILFGKRRDGVHREYQQKLLEQDLLYRQKLEELVAAKVKEVSEASSTRPTRRRSPFFDFTKIKLKSQNPPRPYNNM